MADFKLENWLPQEPTEVPVADIRVEDLIIEPSSVYVGEKVYISVTATNYGAAAGTKKITYEVYTPPQYSLTIETVGQGTMSPAPGVWEYPDGALVRVSAIPSAGWLFDHWEGDISGIENPVEFTITSDMRIVAVFSEVVVPPEQCAASISIVGSGTTNPAPGTYLVDRGTILTITASPAEGWLFDHWGGDIPGTINPVNIEVLEDISIVAVFAEQAVVPPVGCLPVVAAGILLVAGIIAGIILLV